MFTLFLKQKSEKVFHISLIFSCQVLFLPKLKKLITILKKSKNNEIKVEAIIGDGAYSEKDNLEYCEKNNIKNVSKLSKMATHGNGKNKDDFEYNKDAGMYVCKAEHMAIKKAKQGTIHGCYGDSRVEAYYFDVEKCKHCPFKDGCYKDGTKQKHIV